VLVLSEAVLVRVIEPEDPSPITITSTRHEHEAVVSKLNDPV
jgi:hypothetical protein